MADVRWQDDAVAEVLKAVENFQDEILDDVLSDMKRMVPVDTGELRDSLEKGGPGRINIGAKHGPLVEFGTENMAAQPFIRPAVYRKRGA
jgi:hypothetical protein